MLDSFNARLTVATVLLVLAGMSVSGTLDRYGHAEVEAGLERSLLAFGLARGINAVISVVQGSEIALQPAGLGVTLSVGEALDPVNDLVERFSWLMLASSVSFALQRFLLEFGGWAWFAYGVAGVLVLAAAVLLGSGPRFAGMRPVLLRMAAVLVLLRFAVPCAAIANEILYAELLAPRYEQARTTVTRVHDELETLENDRDEGVTGPSFDASDGWTDKLSRFFDAVAATVDVRAGWAREKAAYAQTVAAMTNSVIDMMAVFVVQAVLVPLGFLVALWVALRRVLRT